jgi:hypothetical protein
MTKNKFTLKIISKVIIILSIIAVAAIVVSFFSTQIKKINSTMAEKKEMDYLISNREQVGNKIKSDFSTVDPAYQEKITGSIPSVYNILSFVDATDSLAKKHSLKQTVSFSQPEPATEIAGPISLMLIDFNITIDETNVEIFTNYLKDFEQLPYFASINSINYLGGGKSGWQGNSSINISGSLYAHQ